MKYKGNYISNSFTFNSEALYTFIYDGSYWILEGDWDSYKKQDILVSGTNIKTINGKSLLGSGDIEIGGGSSSIMKNVLIGSSGDIILKPNERAICFGSSIGRLTISGFEVTPFSENPLDNADSWVDEYSVVFKTTFGDNSPLTLPDYVLWANGMLPEIEDDTVYELSITRYSMNPNDSDTYYKAVLIPFKQIES